jgi:hypothetical protein
MLRPTPGELLAGVRRELYEQVLPHVPDGTPARQLRAALHVLGRLERSWDLLPTYLEADNADLRHALTDLAGRLGATWIDRPPAGGDEEVPGVQDPTLRSLIVQNAHLQSELDRVQQEGRAQSDGGTNIAAEIDIELHALHTRMAQRAARATAVADGH